jgi:phosphoglycolate phosphatase-like HAD superfamily hydrolase
VIASLHALLQSDHPHTSEQCYRSCMHPSDPLPDYASDGNWIPPAPLLHLIEGSKVLIWDFDGVIADTEPLQARSYQQVLRQLGVSDTDELLSHRIGLSEREMWSALSERYGIRESGEALMSKRSVLYLGLARQQTAPRHFVRPLLESTAQRKVSSIIVSSGGYRNLSALLKCWNIQALFSEIYCNGSPHSRSLPTKLDRLLHVVSSYGLPATIIEDSPEYLAHARRHALRTVGVAHSLNSLIADECDILLQT